MTGDIGSDIFTKLDIKKYKGKWVAICETDIVSFGEDAKKTFDDAKRKCPTKKIVIARVPEEQTMIY